MDMKRRKRTGLSEKSSQLCALLSLITLVIYCIYGIMYNYFDIVVFLALVLGTVCAQGYVFTNNEWADMLNLVAVTCLSFGVGLFFLNSYPVWADRLNNIEMYGSRGTLMPVVLIILLHFACILLGVISCFTLNQEGVKDEEA